MPIYLFWGEDDFSIAQRVAKLRQSVLDPNWLSFNDEKIIGDQDEKIIQGFNQGMTPPFGMGGRVVWIANTTIFNHCASPLLAALKRTLESLPEQTTLIFTTTKKPDGRSKATKYLKKQGNILECSLIPPWKIEALHQRVQQLAQEVDVRLTPKAVAYLVESVGNNTRQLWGELEKLKLYSGENSAPIQDSQVAQLVLGNTHNSLQLATAILQGKDSQALEIVADLINQNEPPLRIIATLVGQFRTWTMVKLMVKSGKDNQAIASFAEISNPKRIYFLRNDIQSVSSQQLLATFPLLLQLEFKLKRGFDVHSTLQSQIIELCQLFN